MTPPIASDGSVTALLVQLCRGDGAARMPLFEQVYTELRNRATLQRGRWKGVPPLETTALINEAYLRLVEQGAQSWASRSHFFAVAATAMRYILINWARKERAQKRGGSVRKISLEELQETFGRDVAVSDETAELLVVMDEALDRLDASFPRAARGVECRSFGSMTIPETAEALGVSEATVSRDWAAARIWLYREMKRIIDNDASDNPH